MRTLELDEMELVSGGVCEEMSLKECIAGVSQQATDEISVALQNIGAAASDAWSWWNDVYDVGIWAYNISHSC